MELNEREAHCVARLLQGAIFGEDITTGCAYCKVRCDEKLLAGSIRKRLTEETGVDLGVINGDSLPYTKIPHGRFLKNAHADAKKYYRDLLKSLDDV